ncbi:hypothetical protein M569_16518 [Genlisea aurea]|uniref:Uncharacterized protein n=1 Tax=Genlisea aurea TaxID=192259 RepID=S8DFZ1_9LAMI|nr:hypothetical protein M569_16518 [Genlisea aurea]
MGFFIDADDWPLTQLSELQPWQRERQLKVEDVEDDDVAVVARNGQRWAKFGMGGDPFLLRPLLFLQCPPPNCYVCVAGSERTERAGLKSVLQFAQVCEGLGAQYPTLDAFFCAWGGWVVKPSLLFQKEEEMELCEARRMSLAAQFGVDQCSFPAATFRTYVNAVTRVYTRAMPDVMIVPSSQRQFPLFDKWFTDLNTRERAARAISTAANPPTDVLSVSEFRCVMSTVDTSNVFQNQQANILALAFGTGFRAEVLRRLQSDSFQTSQKEGRTVLTVVVGTMKNLSGSFAKADAALFRQVIVSGDDPLTCPVAAVARQQALLEMAPNKGHTNWLFRTCRPISPHLSDEPVSDEMFRGVAAWASMVVQRRCTFKDVARRAAMTRLASDSALSREDVAKYFGVNRNTVAVYHQMARGTPFQAGAILASANLRGPPPATMASTNKARALDSKRKRSPKAYAHYSNVCPPLCSSAPSQLQP